MLTLFINTWIVPIGIFLAFTTYDLHPFSCISKEREKFIKYTIGANDTGGTVEIQFPDSMKIYRIVAVGLLFILGFFFIINIICFYKKNFKIIEEYEKEVENQYTKIDESLPQE